MTRCVSTLLLGKLLDLCPCGTDLYNIAQISADKVDLSAPEISCNLVHGERDSKQLKKVSGNRGVKMGWPVIGGSTLGV